MIPINVSSNLPIKNFKSAKALYVVSIFNTIQSEGPLAGTPATFVRLGGCNFGGKDIHCQWCDTNFDLSRATQYTPSALVRALKEAKRDSKCDLLVITGGEPTLQPLILDVLDELYKENIFDSFQFESNGTVPSFIKELVTRACNIKTTYVVSPKANTLTGRYQRLDPEVISRADALKFILSADEENIHHAVPDWAENLHNIYVSPMAVYKRPPDSEIASIWDDTLIDRDATMKNYMYTAQYAMEKGYMLSIQSHLFVNLP